MIVKRWAKVLNTINTVRNVTLWRISSTSYQHRSIILIVVIPRSETLFLLFFLIFFFLSFSLILNVFTLKRMPFWIMLMNDRHLVRYGACLAEIIWSRLRHNQRKRNITPFTQLATHQRIISTRTYDFVALLCKRIFFFFFFSFSKSITSHNRTSPRFKF